MIAHRRAGPSASAVAQQGDISPRLEIADLSVRCEKAELNKMIPAAAGSQLRPRPVLVFLSDRADGPIGVQHFVCAAIFESGADSEARFGFNGAGETILTVIEIARLYVEHCHFHAAGDVHAL